mmetsp:Transcript_33283/g.75242  ORF Transcript_33283/g.75242 Transcript_33283/m.75242 type:complete len:203 (+) Transcript_33283:142-750(+)
MGSACDQSAWSFVVPSHSSLISSLVKSVASPHNGAGWDGGGWGGGWSGGLNGGRCGSWNGGWSGGWSGGWNTAPSVVVCRKPFSRTDRMSRMPMTTRVLSRSPSRQSRSNVPRTWACTPCRTKRSGLPEIAITPLIRKISSCFFCTNFCSQASSFGSSTSLVVLMHTQLTPSPAAASNPGCTPGRTPAPCVPTPEVMPSAST